MKIISISPYNFFKKNSGVNNRIFFVSRYLDQNYKTIHCIRDSDYIKKENDEFNGEVILGGKNKITHILSLNIVRKIITEKRKDIDVILYCHTLWGGIYGLFMNIFFQIPYIFDNHNVEFLRFKRTGKKYWQIIKLLEKKIITHSKITYVCSMHDMEYLENVFNLKSTKIEVVENGVYIDEEIFEKKIEIKKEIRKKHNIGTGENILLYSGGFTYQPNSEALQYIHSTLIPEIENKNLPYTFLICGGGYEKYEIQSKKIIYTGSVSNILDYNIASDMLVAPIKSGSGTKLKILEALGYGVKVLTTKVGAEGIDENKYMKVVNSIHVEDITAHISNNIDIKLQYQYSWENILKKIKI